MDVYKLLGGDIQIPNLDPNQERRAKIPWKKYYYKYNWVIKLKISLRKTNENMKKKLKKELDPVLALY